MRSHILVTLAICGLAACSSSTVIDSKHGSFVPSVSAAHEMQMADDAVHQLASLFPPASTRFTMAHAAQDGFGKQLLDKLRIQGYALREASLTDTASAKDAQESSSESNADTSFAYVLDSIASPKLYRVTLNVGQQTISRAYLQQNDVVHPAGAWVRKE